MNIYFDKTGSFDEWRLKLLYVTISFPEIKEQKVDIPGRDGSLDLSTLLTGDVQYHNRMVEYTFDTTGNAESWAAMSSRIANTLHGRYMRIIHEFDPGYYYEGRLTVNSQKSNEYMHQMVITGDVYPYKYEINDGTEDWKWNPFDLENGVIREYKDLTVSGQRKVVIIGRRKPEIPEVICDTEMTLKYGTMTIQLPAGRTKLYELMLGEGEHELVFTGNGTVTISYRGGSL